MLGRQREGGTRFIRLAGDVERPGARTPCFLLLCLVGGEFEQPPVHRRSCPEGERPLGVERRPLRVEPSLAA